MTKIIRYTDAFYEQNGPYAVLAADARHIYQTAARTVGQHVGRIVFSEPSGVSMSQNAYPLLAAVDLLGTANHTALITGGPIVDELSAKKWRLGRSQPRELGGACAREFAGNLVVRSQTLVKVDPASSPFEKDIATVAAIHEVAHSCGGEHCAAPGCIMQAGLITEHTEIERLLSLANPFCDTCSDDLQAAGRRMEAIYYR